MYHSTVEDLVRNVKGTRIFKRYPWYRIENKTGESLKLKTYGVSDLVRMFPSMAVQVDPGSAYIDASAGDVEEEQAFFSLPDGREWLTVLRASGTVTVTSDSFRHNPYYKVENLTGENISLTTYSTSDFVYLVPAMTVEVPPGISYIMASSRDVQEEQAVFTLMDGRSYHGFNIKAFETIHLQVDKFEKYPFYKIENHTGELVTLTTYATSDFMYLVPSMVVDVPMGTQYIHSSSANVIEEQASFSMNDGRDFSGFNMKAFQTVVLKRDYFR
jgi:hypothetical protein